MYVCMPADQVFLISFLLVILSICASRLMLGIRCLAASVAFDPTFLLNNVEMGRIIGRMKHGAGEAELLVEVDAVVDELIISSSRQNPGTVRATRVGRWNDFQPQSGSNDGDAEAGSR